MIKACQHYIHNCGKPTLLFYLCLTYVCLQDLRDGLNHGLYSPPANGKAGKFLDEERPLRDYPLPGPIGYLEVSTPPPPPRSDWLAHGERFFHICYIHVQTLKNLKMQYA